MGNIASLAVDCSDCRGKSMNYRKRLLAFCEICLLAAFCSIFLSACFDFTSISACNGNQTTCNNVGNNNPGDAAAAATQNSINSEYATITNSKPLLIDPLTQQDKNQWDTESYSDGSHCSFQDQSYVASVLNNGDGYYCLSGALNYGDAAIQMDVTLTDGMLGGLAFRGQYINNATDFYFFYVTTDGQFGLDLYRGSANSPTDTITLIDMNPNDAVLGAGERNQLMVIMKGPKLMLFANGTFLAQISDNTYTSGLVGIQVENNSSTSPNTASFTNLVVYKD